MRLDRRFVIVLSSSLLWATIVAGVFYRLATGSGVRARAGVLKPMVVAAVALPAGAMIDRVSLKLREVPESMVPAGAFSKIDDVLDRPVISPIQAEEPVVEARIAAKGSGAGLAPLIPSGMRAIAVRVNDVVGVAGFVLPGMRVDVLFTGRSSNQADTVTRTVLQDIQVLSAGQTTQTDGKSQAIVVPVVTLLVNPLEAESLTLANGEGRIQLVLRNSTDRGVAVTGGRRLHEIFGSAAAESQERGVPAASGPSARPRTRTASEAAVAIPAFATVEATGAPSASSAPPPPEPDQMTVIRGAVKTLEVFRKEGGA